MKSLGKVVVVGLVLGSAVAAVWVSRSSDAARSAQLPVAAASTAPAATPSGSVKRGLPITPWAAIPSATAPLRPNMGISERFEIEAKSRPPNARPSADDVFAAIEKAGVKIVDKKQHLGSPFGARYCVGGRAVANGEATDPTLLHISACELIDADLAAKSRDYSEATLKGLSNRYVYANKQSTLTVREEQRTPEADAIMEKVVGVYKGL